MAETINFDALNLTDLADLGRRPLPLAGREKAAVAVAQLMANPSTGPRLRRRAEIVARLLAVGVTSPQEARDLQPVTTGAKGDR